VKAEVKRITNQVASTDRPSSDVNAVVSRLGFWSAVLTAVLAAAFFAVGIASPVRYISYPYVEGVSAFIPVDYIWMYPPFLLAPTFVVLVACIHAYASDDKKVFSQVALSFAVIYAAIITTDYFIQWTVIQPSILSGETAGLSLLTQYNPHGILIALEGLAYLMMNGALLFAAVVFAGGRRECALRWLFVISFVMAVGSFVALSLLRYDIVTFEVTIITINCTVLIVSGALLSVVFKRAG
jgi:hypothetical protein